MNAAPRAGGAATARPGMPAWFPSHRGALLAYLVLFAAVMAPFWLGGEVIAPDRQEVALGLADIPDATHPENPLFADHRNVYVPEVSALLRAPRSGWLATWDPYNELGRPLYHDAGMSPAYLPTRALFALSGEPRRILTWLSVLTALLGGLFAFGLARESGLAPAACLVAAAFLGLGPPTLFWLAFPMFHAVLAWACGCLYAVALLRRRPTLAAWALLSFCVYSLLLTGYQQDIVLHAYLLAGFGIAAAWHVRRTQGTAAAGRLVAIALSAVATGLLAASPVYVDLWVRARESARLAVDAGFFLANLPAAGTVPDVLKLVAGFFFQDVFGNPSTPGFAWGVGDMSLPPLFALLVVVAITLRGKRALGWGIAVAVCAVFTFCHPAYRFAIAHLGLALSFSNPMYTALIPLAMLAAHGADALLSAPPPTVARGRLAIALAAGLLAATATLAIVLAQGAGVAPRWGYVALGVAVLAGIAIALRAPRTAPALLVALVVVTAWAHGRELLLSQPPARIAATSPLVEDLRRALPPGGRYAMVGNRPLLLEPNVNATLGLPSVHTYNSLSSRRYQALMARLGGETSIHGRHNRTIAPRFGGVDVLLARIAVVVATMPLADPALTRLPSSTPGVWLYRVDAFRACCLRLPAPAGDGDDAMRVASLAGADWTSIRLREDRGDIAWYDVAATPDASLLVTATAWQPQWRAFALDARGRHAPLRVRAVNDALLGIELPPGTQRVELAFLPAVRFAWLAHAFYLLLAAVLAVRCFASRRAPAAPTPVRATDDPPQ